MMMVRLDKLVILLLICWNAHLITNCLSTSSQESNKLAALEKSDELSKKPSTESIERPDANKILPPPVVEKNDAVVNREFHEDVRIEEDEDDELSDVTELDDLDPIKYKKLAEKRMKTTELPADEKIAAPEETLGKPVEQETPSVETKPAEPPSHKHEPYDVPVAQPIVVEQPKLQEPITEKDEANNIRQENISSPGVDKTTEIKPVEVPQSNKETLIAPEASSQNFVKEDRSKDDGEKRSEDVVKESHGVMNTSEPDNLNGKNTQNETEIKSETKVETGEKSQPSELLEKQEESVNATKNETLALNKSDSIENKTMLEIEKKIDTMQVNGAQLTEQNGGELEAGIKQTASVSTPESTLGKEVLSEPQVPSNLKKSEDIDGKTSNESYLKVAENVESLDTIKQGQDLGSTANEKSESVANLSEKIQQEKTDDSNIQSVGQNETKFESNASSTIEKTLTSKQVESPEELKSEEAQPNEENSKLDVDQNIKPEPDTKFMQETTSTNNNNDDAEKTQSASTTTTSTPNIESTTTQYMPGRNTKHSDIINSIKLRNAKKKLADEADQEYEMKQQQLDKIDANEQQKMDQQSSDVSQDNKIPKHHTNVHVHNAHDYENSEKHEHVHENHLHDHYSHDSHDHDHLHHESYSQELNNNQQNNADDLKQDTNQPSHHIESHEQNEKDNAHDEKNKIIQKDDSIHHENYHHGHGHDHDHNDHHGHSHDSNYVEPQAQLNSHLEEQNETTAKVLPVDELNHHQQNHAENNESSQQKLNTDDDVSQNATPRQQQQTNIKYCADLNQIKYLFDNHIQPIYLPLVNLLPNDFQLMLMGESAFVGLNWASCLFLTTILTITLSVWYTLSRLSEGRKLTINVNLNEQLLAATNKIKKLEFDNKTFANLVEDVETKQNKFDSILNERDLKIRELEKTVAQLSHAHDMGQKDLGKLKSHESKLVKELNQAKIDLNSLSETCTRQKLDYEMELSEISLNLNAQLQEFNEKSRTNEEKIQEYERVLAQKSSKIEELMSIETRLKEELEAKENTIMILKNSLIVKNVKGTPDLSKSSSPAHNNNNNDTDSDANSDDFVNVAPQSIIEGEESNLDLMMTLGKMRMEIKSLESELDEVKKSYESKTKENSELNELLKEKLDEMNMLELRKKQLEKSVKENEMQIKLLNELREKDTKQHLKALSEIDTQLKKKSTDADKVSHLLDQIRVKQERIQELESSLNRVERQSNQERQTFEKQTHENWLNSKKIEKELRECKLELASLREKSAELEYANKSLTTENMVIKQSADKLSSTTYMQNYINQIPHKTMGAKAPSESGMSENGDSLQMPPRPPSTSSNPGGIMASASYGSIPFIRAPFPLRYPPFPPPINPAAMAYMQHQQQQQQQQQQQLEQQNHSASSSSPSPDLSTGAQQQQQQQQARMQMMYRMHPLMYQHQQYLQQQQQQQQQHKSEVSSQQTSPGSTSLNSNPPMLMSSSILNDSSMRENSQSSLNNHSDLEPKFESIVEENNSLANASSSSNKHFDV